MSSTSRMRRTGHGTAVRVGSLGQYKQLDKKLADIKAIQSAELFNKSLGTGLYSEAIEDTLKEWYESRVSPDDVDVTELKQLSNVTGIDVKDLKVWLDRAQSGYGLSKKRGKGDGIGDPSRGFVEAKDVNIRTASLGRKSSERGLDSAGDNDDKSPRTKKTQKALWTVPALAAAPLKKDRSGDKGMEFASTSRASSAERGEQTGKRNRKGKGGRRNQEGTEEEEEEEEFRPAGGESRSAKRKRTTQTSPSLAKTEYKDAPTFVKVGSTFSQPVLDVLGKYLITHLQRPMPGSRDVIKLAYKTRLTPAQVNQWFRNQTRRVMETRRGKNGEIVNAIMKSKWHKFEHLVTPYDDDSEESDFVRDVVDDTLLFNGHYCRPKDQLSDSRLKGENKQTGARPLVLLGPKPGQGASSDSKNAVANGTSSPRPRQSDRKKDNSHQPLGEQNPIRDSEDERKKRDGKSWKKSQKEVQSAAQVKLEIGDDMEGSSSPIIEWIKKNKSIYPPTRKKMELANAMGVTLLQLNWWLEEISKMFTKVISGHTFSTYALKSQYSWSDLSTIPFRDKPVRVISERETIQRLIASNEASQAELERGKAN
eukprot:Nk52_evm13s1837 gene=Nk52_evmTU13s1837